MSSTRTFVRRSREALQMRPVLPVNIPIKLGDVFEVLSDQSLFRVGTIADFLGVDPGAAVESLKPIASTGPSIQFTSGDEVALDVSGIVDIDGVPGIDAGGDVSVELGGSNSFVCFVSRPTITALENPHRIHGPILAAALASAELDGDSGSQPVFKENYVVITALNSPERWSALLSTSRGTKVKLSFEGAGNVPAGPVVDVAARLGVTHSSKGVTHHAGDGGPAFYQALRIKRDWWMGGIGVHPHAVDSDLSSAFEDVSLVDLAGDDATGGDG